jgi:hypothetical protein
MRAVETVMMALAVTVLGVGIWAVHKWVPRSGLSIFRPAGSEAVKDAKAPEPPPAKPAPAAQKRPFARTREVTLPLGAIEVDVPARFPFPSPGDLPAGITRSQVIARYGEPIARVSGVEDGRLLERYYFLHPDRIQMTVATLRNGVVASADTVSNHHVTAPQP